MQTETLFSSSFSSPQSHQVLSSSAPATMSNPNVPSQQSQRLAVGNYHFSSISNLQNETDLERKKFMDGLHAVMQDMGKSITKMPVMGYRELDLYTFYKEVQSYGGYASVTEKVGTWSKIWKKLGNFDTSITDASFRLKKNYERFLLEYEYREYPLRRREDKLGGRSKRPRSRDNHSISPSKKMFATPSNSKETIAQKRNRVKSSDAILESFSQNETLLVGPSPVSSNSGNTHLHHQLGHPTIITNGEPGSMLSSTGGPVSSSPRSNNKPNSSNNSFTSPSPSPPNNVYSSQTAHRSLSSPSVYNRNPPTAALHNSLSASSTFPHSLNSLESGNSRAVGPVFSSESLLSLSPLSSSPPSPSSMDTFFNSSPPHFETFNVEHGAVTPLNSLGTFEGGAVTNWAFDSLFNNDPLSDMLTSEDGMYPSIPGVDDLVQTWMND